MRSSTRSAEVAEGRMAQVVGCSPPPCAKRPDLHGRRGFPAVPDVDRGPIVTAMALATAATLIEWVSRLCTEWPAARPAR